MFVSSFHFSPWLVIYTEGCKSRYTVLLCITLITVYLLLHPSVFHLASSDVSTALSFKIPFFATRRFVTAQSASDVSNNVLSSSTRVKSSEKNFPIILIFKAVFSASHGWEIVITWERYEKKLLSPTCTGQNVGSLDRWFINLTIFFNYRHMNGEMASRGLRLSGILRDVCL